MKKRWAFIIFCLTLGLAPWWLNEEPHLVGKVKWVLGGAEGMAPMDYFDLVLHGTPWLFLIWTIIQEFILTKKEGETSS